MAQIVKYTAGEQINPGRAPQPVMSNAVGRAVQGLGGAIADFAGLAAKSEQKKKEKNNFLAQSNFRKFNLEQGEAMLKEQENMSPDGSGFHENYVKNVYTPARDKFLANLPDDPELREKFGVMLGDGGETTTEFSIKAAGVERDRTYKWYEQEIGIGQQELATGIAQNPEGYDAYLKQGFDEIEASGMTSAMKYEQRASWERFAQISHLNTMIERDPEGVLFELDADPRNLSPTTQFEMLRKAVVYQESRGRPGAISPKGAAGIMQVMPDTADEIAGEIGDKNYNPNWTENQKQRYLSNPVIGMQYGSHYLKKQIRRYGSEGGLEAALVAYNAGGKVAERWIKSGFDDSVLPKETREYYTDVMARLPGSTGRNVPKGSAKNVQINFRSPGDSIEVSKDLQDRVKSSFGALGINEIKVNSGHRTEAENRAAGGAKKSQHITGNAMDIDVSGYTNAERVQLIEMLSSNGVTGLGIGSNIIHADMGGRRAWGYATSAGGGEVPAWAKGAIDRHLAGKSQPPVRGGNGGSGRYASLPYADRQKFIADAGQAVTQRYNGISAQNAVVKVQLQQSMENELASLRTTGKTTGLDETQVATILGEDDYLKYTAKKATATRVFSARDGINTMTPEEMNERMLDYEPQAGSSTFNDDLQVKAAVAKEVERVTSQRTNRPDKAAMEYPDVKEAYNKIVDAQANGTPVNPTDMQAFVAATLERQKEFNLKPGSEAPVPREMGMEIGSTITRQMESVGKKLTDQRAALSMQYQSLQEIFGPYTEEVIIYALSEYKGMGKNSADMVVGVMQAIEAGGDPLKLRKRDQATDMDQVEGAAEEGWWPATKKAMSELWYGERSDEGDIDPGPPEPVADGPVSPETLIRVIGYLNGATEEDEAELVARYGQNVVDAAKRKQAGAE